MIRKAKYSDLESIAILHSESFEDHFLPKLGVKLLSKYYKEFINEKNIFLVSADGSDEINGLVLGTPDSSTGRNQFIQNNKIELSLRILLLCLKFDVDTYVRVIEFMKKKVFSVPHKVNSSNQDKTFVINSISLLSICVSKNVKGTGVANLLIKEFEQILMKNGFNRYLLTVHKNNDRANYFYKKNGMTVLKESEREYVYIKTI